MTSSFTAHWRKILRYDDVECIKIGDIDYITKRIEKEIEEEERLSRADKVKVKVKRNDRYKISKGRLKHGGSKRKNPKKPQR